jgi:hypothetical protein
LTKRGGGGRQQAKRERERERERERGEAKVGKRERLEKWRRWAESLDSLERLPVRYFAGEDEKDQESRRVAKQPGGGFGCRLCDGPDAAG